MSEPQAPEGDSPAEVAAADQAIASARHAAECTARYYQQLLEGGVPAELAGQLTLGWLRWFLTDDTDDEDE